MQFWMDTNKDGHSGNTVHLHPSRHAINILDLRGTGQTDERAFFGRIGRAIGRWTSGGCILDGTS